VATGLAPWLIYAMFEEWGWRGYLEPMLTRLGIPDLRRHFMVGIIWAVWHIPYVLGTPAYTELSPVPFAALFMGSILVMAVVHGQLRKASGSVWPVVLAHGLGNATAHPLVSGGFADFRFPALIATRPENLLFIILWSIIGWFLLRKTPLQNDERQKEMK
jgi:membrane protease YdiL (CAAX protease family)